MSCYYKIFFAWKIQKYAMNVVAILYEQAKKNSDQITLKKVSFFLNIAQIENKQNFKF